MPTRFTPPTQMEIGSAIETGEVTQTSNIPVQPQQQTPNYIPIERFRRSYSNAQQNGYFESKTAFAQGLTEEGYTVQGFQDYQKKVGGVEYKKGKQKAYFSMIGDVLDRRYKKTKEQFVRSTDTLLEDLNEDTSGAKQYQQLEGQKMSVFTSAMTPIGQTAGTIGDIAFNSLGRLGLWVTPDALEDKVKEGAETLRNGIKDKQFTRDAIETLGQGVELAEDWADKHPNEAMMLDNAIGFLDLVGAGYTAKLGKKGFTAGKEVLQDGIEKAKNINLLSFEVPSVSKIITGNDPNKMITQAINPRLNTLAKGKTAKEAFEGIENASKSVVQRAKTIPVDTETHAQAWKEAMTSTWDDIKVKLNGGEGLDINGKEIANALDEYIAKNPAMKNAQANDYKRVLNMKKTLEELGDKDVMYWENWKQIYNDLAGTSWGENAASDSMKNAYKTVSGAIGKQLDAKLSSVPGEFASLKKEYGALAGLYDDVWKSNILNARKKGLGLTETYSRLEGIGDIIGAVGGVVSGNNPLSGIAKGGAKIVIGKEMAKLKDADYLIKTGYDDLIKKMSAPVKEASKAGAAIADATEKQLKDLGYTDYMIKLHRRKYPAK